MGNCVYYIYRIFGFTEKLNSADMLNAQNCVNPMVNCAYQMDKLSGVKEN